MAGDPGLLQAEHQEVLDPGHHPGRGAGPAGGRITELARGESATSALGDVRLDEVVAAGLVDAAGTGRGPFTADLEPCVVFGSAERLQMAVRNLLDNAAKFGSPGAPVEVRLVAGELTVRDRGPGIAAADLPHVFDRFYRAAQGPGRAWLRVSGFPSSARWRRKPRRAGRPGRVRARPGNPDPAPPARRTARSRASSEQAGAVIAAVPEREYSSRR